MRIENLMNGKAAGKDEVTAEKVKGEGDMMVEWILKLSNMAFEGDFCA